MLARMNLWIDRCAEWAVIVTFMAIALVGGLQVFCRFILNLPLQWGEEVQIYGHVWIVFLTVPIGYNRGSHILMTMLLHRFPASVQRAVAVLVDLMWLWLGMSIVVFTIRLVRVAAFQMSPSLGIPMSYIYLGMVAGGAYVVVVALRKLAAHFFGGGSRSVAEDAPS